MRTRVSLFVRLQRFIHVVCQQAFGDGHRSESVKCSKRIRALPSTCKFGGTRNEYAHVSIHAKHTIRYWRLRWLQIQLCNDELIVILVQAPWKKVSTRAIGAKLCGAQEQRQSRIRRSANDRGTRRRRLKGRVRGRSRYRGREGVRRRLLRVVAVVARRRIQVSR